MVTVTAIRLHDSQTISFSTAATTVLFTIGHGATAAEQFLERCRRAGLERIVDVRSAPGSRRHPHFGRAEMERWLPAAGVGYRWEPGLGGFRQPLAASVNTGLRHPAFRGYADHMARPEFRAALAGVLQEARSARTAVMCSETLWWRCHRRLIADAAVVLCGADVLHVDGRGLLQPHRVTETAHVVGDDLVYGDRCRASDIAGT